MLPLDDPRWVELRHAYGSAGDVPVLLRYVESSPGIRRPYYRAVLHALVVLCHQGEVYTASYAAVPHLVALVEASPQHFRWTLLALVQAVEAARFAGEAVDMPRYLVGAYFGALRRIPQIAAKLLSSPRTEVECRVILSACAASAGHAGLSDAINELTPETIEKLYDGIFPND